MIEDATPTKKKSSTLEKVSKALIIPLAIACMGAWNDHKLKREKLRADAGYETMAPAMKELQTQVATLAGQVQVLQQLVLVQQTQFTQRRRTVEPETALDKYSDKLVVKVQKSQGMPMVQKRLPEKLDDVLPAAKQ